MYSMRPGTSRYAAAILAGLLALAGCGGDEPATQTGANTEPQPAGTSPAADPAPDSTGRTGAAEPLEVTSESLPYADIENELVYGYFAAPADMFEPLPAVIMIHEWWGLNDEMRARADRLAAQGYIVLAIDLFRGRTATAVAEARNLMVEVVENPETANENIRTAFEFVTQIGAPKVAAMGWRFGGTWSLNAAMLLPDDLDAAVIYYAQVTDDEDKLRPVNAPILGLFAQDDVAVREDMVEAFQAALERLRKDAEIRIYTGVKQGFASENAANYHAPTADNAWSLSLDFLKRHLAAGADASGDS